MTISERLEKVLKLDDVLESDRKLIEHNWYAFYKNPEKYENSVVVDMVLQDVWERRLSTGAWLKVDD